MIMRILATSLLSIAMMFVTSIASPVIAANTGSITIKVDTIPQTRDAVFVFDSPFGPFEIKGDGSRTFYGVQAGNYVIEERSMNGWVLPNVICSDGSNRSGHSAFIELAAGEHVTCEFINESVQPAVKETTVPSPQSSPVVVTPPSTGDAGLLNTDTAR